MASIAVVVNKYPNIIEPNVCVFIQQLVWSFADLGYECSVICPMPINSNPKYLHFPEQRIEKNENGKEVKIYHPKYISLGQSGNTLQKQRVAFTTDMYTMAVDSVLKKMSRKPDFLYAHFICPSGVCASRLGKKYNIPSFMAHGEATYSGDAKYGNKKLAKELDGLSGLVAVSSQNKDFCVNAGIVSDDIVEVFPNGYRKVRFNKHDRVEARKKFNFPEDKFIVGFCGSFDDRKGILRLQEAVDQIEDAYFACAGKGNLVPTSEKCIWAKPVNNEELAWFYSAIDIFALPTRQEGCCNAIVEAIACGLPIISANKSFNIDICNESNSILVDPDDVNALKEAIQELKIDCVKREKLAMGSLEMAKNLTLEQRAKNIIAFMKQKSIRIDLTNRE